MSGLLQQSPELVVLSHVVEDGQEWERQHEPRCQGVENPKCQVQVLWGEQEEGYSQQEGECQGNHLQGGEVDKASDELVDHGANISQILVVNPRVSRASASVVQPGLSRSTLWVGSELNEVRGHVTYGISIE